MSVRKLLIGALAAVLLAGGATAGNAAYPERPITMIVAYSPGGGTDVLARTIAGFMEKYIGTSIVVVNKPGAGGEVGFTALAHAKADGYTIGFVNLPPLLTIPISRKAKYSLDDFAPIANLVDDPGAFNVHPSSEFKTLKQLVEHAKKNPNSVTVGTSGIGGDDHLSMLFFAKAAGVKLTHVPFPGGAPNRKALLGRHITVGGFNISEAIQYAKNGQIVSLGQMGEKRWPSAGDVPTFKEQGFDIVMGSQRGLAAPKGVPADILKKIAAAVEKAVNDPEFQEKAKKTYLPLRYMPPQDYGEFLKQMNAKVQKLWDTDPWIKK